MTRTLTGHRDLRLGIGPFARVAPALVVATAWFAATVAVGLLDVRVGGRWLVVHLFTLGVLTNLLVAFTQHFARSVTRVDADLGPRALLALNLGVVGVLAGMVAGAPALLAGGATTVVAIIALGRVQLSRMRAAAVSTRFDWLVATYARAYEALAVAAALGAAMGAGAVPGAWYGSVRLSHLHLTLLGWTGLVVIATVAFFTPAMLRLRAPEGSEARAARSLRAGTGGLAVAALALAVPDVAGAAGTAVDLVAAAALAVYAWPVVAVTRSVLAMARGAHPAAAKPLTAAAMLWFCAVVGTDVVVVATDAVAWQPALGLAVGLGVGVQLILAVALNLLPSLRGRGFAARDALIARTEQRTAVRAVALNAAIGAIVFQASPTVTPPAWVAATAWAVVLAVVAHAVLLAVLPVDADPTVARSSVARRYRGAQADA
ncbi:hypothetical protein [Euzebya sp.]|uniref:hypothetical protein n=1 Tax=Euzebya sp. TaxID=1971409 RepID=UPI0035151C49